MEIDFKRVIHFSEYKSSSKFEENVLEFIEEWFSSSETVQVQTSGSTGTPKIFEIEKLRMLASAKKTCDFLDLKEGNTALLCLPIEYISGKMMAVRSIFRKLKLHIVTPSLNPLEHLHQEIDFCAMTPLQVENSLDKLHLIKKLIIGGASVSENLKSQISNLKLQNQIFETSSPKESISSLISLSRRLHVFSNGNARLA